MKDGFYQAIITLPGDVTHCVVVLHDGKVYGGDSITCFEGNYQLSGNEFRAQLRTRRYSKLVNLLPIFGEKPADVTVVGVVEADNTLRGTCTSPAAPGLKAALRLIPLSARG
jgi:hypothetical protein